MCGHTLRGSDKGEGRGCFLLCYDIASHWCPWLSLESQGEPLPPVRLWAEADPGSTARSRLPPPVVLARALWELDPRQTRTRARLTSLSLLPGVLPG